MPRRLGAALRLSAAALTLSAAALTPSAAALGLAGCGLSFHQGPLPGAPKSARFAEVAGARVHYVDEGSGPPVVLIHGFASSMHTWRGVRQALKPSHRVIALDLKGFGYTDRPEGDYSPRAQAELVLALLDARGVDEPVALVAHSWGSSVALELALLAPERVSRIALYDAWVYEEQLPTTFHVAKLGGVGEAIIGGFYDQRSDDKMGLAFYDRNYVTEEMIEGVERDLERPGTKAAALAAIRGQRYAEVQKRYPKITQPTLLLWGREDRITRLEYGERLAKELPNARLVVYPQCGHFPMYEAKGSSTNELRAFLAEATPPKRALEPAPANTPEPTGAPEAAPAPEPASEPEQSDDPRSRR